MLCSSKCKLQPPLCPISKHKSTTNTIPKVTAVEDEDVDEAMETAVEPDEAADVAMALAHPRLLLDPRQLLPHKCQV